MALSQIFGDRQQVVDNGGDPLTGGKVFLYEINTTTPITSYSDSGATTENPHPVILDAYGRANIWVTRNCDVRITDANGALISEELSVNPDDLGGDFDSGLIPNGSFETDVDSDDVPDGWTVENEGAGSNNGIQTTGGESTSGQNSYRTESTGSGGGELVTTDFFPVNDQDDLRVFFDLRSTVAAVRNIVRVEWYDVSLVSISNTDVYDSTSNPTTFTGQQLLASPPVNARFAKLRIMGGISPGDQTGITYWDNFRVFYPQIVAGIFDNITIQNNDIIATNTDGNMNFKVNGAGTFKFQVDSVEKFNIDAASGVVSQYRGQFPKLHAIDTNAVTLGGNDHALQAGPQSGVNIAVDGGQLQARNNGVAAALAIQALGGALNLGAQAGTGETTIFGTALKRQATRADGIDLFSDANGDPTIPNNLALNVSLQSANGNEYATIGFQGGNSDLVIRSRAHGSPVKIEAENASGTLRTMIEADPDTGVTLRDGADAALVAQAGDVDVRSAGNTDTEERLLRFTHQDGSIRAHIGHDSENTLSIESLIHGAPIALRGENAGGTLRTLLSADPDGSASIYHAGANVVRAQTDGAGLIIHSDGNTDTESRRLLFEHQNGSRRAHIGHDSETTFSIESNIHGAPIALRGEDAGGTLRTLLSADPDGGAELYHTGNLRFRTTSLAVDVIGSAADTARVDMYQSDGSTLIGRLGFLSSNDLFINNEINSGAVRLRGRNSGASVTNILFGDPNGGVALYFQDTSQLSTVSETASGNLSGALVRHRSGTNFTVGLSTLPIVTVNAARTISGDDWHRTLIHDESTARTWTFNTETTVPNGAVMWCINHGTGQLTLAQGAGVTISRYQGLQAPASGNVVLPQGAWVTVLKVGNSAYYVTGARVPI